MSNMSAFWERYASLLESHLTVPNEAALLSAHELGRQALTDGLGVLDLAMLHHKALSIVAAAGSSPDKATELDQAAEFFVESLSPFEMSLRGYRESNAHLWAIVHFHDFLQRNIKHTG